MLEDLQNCAASSCCDGEQRDIYSEHALMVDLQERLRGFKYASELAKSLGISPQYLSDVLKNRRSVIPLAEKLGYTQYRVFVKTESAR